MSAKGETCLFGQQGRDLHLGEPGAVSPPLAFSRASFFVRKRDGLVEHLFKCANDV
jgi:hypothetical protein